MTTGQHSPHTWYTTNCVLLLSNCVLLCTWYLFNSLLLLRKMIQILCPCKNWSSEVPTGPKTGSTEDGILTERLWHGKQKGCYWINRNHNSVFCSLGISQGGFLLAKKVTASLIHLQRSSTFSKGILFLVNQNSLHQLRDPHTTDYKICLLSW